MLKLTALLLILSLADANWSTWCSQRPQIPYCNDGDITGVPDFCPALPDDIEKCMVACTSDISKCDWTDKWDDWSGNWENTCKTIPEENWKWIEQCKDGGKGVGKYGGGGGGGGGSGSTNAAPSAGGLVMMATMQGVVGALLLTA